MSTPKEAMKQFCRECVSGDIRHVKECQGDAIACPLYPYRMGKNEAHKSRLGHVISLPQNGR